MTIEGIKSARELAETFVKLASTVLVESVGRIDNGEQIHFFLNAGKNTGALRRASLDLTRALADMRKP